MKHFILRGAVASLLLGAGSTCFPQAGVTITGGPGTPTAPAPNGPAAGAYGATNANVGAAPQTPVTVTGYGNTSNLSEERVRQIVREELQRLGMVPPTSISTGPIGVNPNPTAGPRRVPAPNNPATGVAGPNSTVDPTTARDTVGVISGGSAGAGVVTPGGATGASATDPTVNPGVTGPGGNAGRISGGATGAGTATGAAGPTGSSTPTGGTPAPAPPRTGTGR